MSSRVYLFFPPRGHEPPPTLRDRLNPYLSLQRRRFPVLRYAKRPDVALYAIGPLFLLPPRPLRTAPSRFPNMIRFGSRPPLIRMSVPAPKSLLVRNVVSMLSHEVISRARLYEVIRWSDLLRCVLMMRRPGVRYGVERSVPGEGSMYCIHTRGSRLPRPLPFGS